MVLTDLPDRTRVRVGHRRNKHVAHSERERAHDRKEGQEEGEEGQLLHGEHHRDRLRNE